MFWLQYHGQTVHSNIVCIQQTAHSYGSITISDLSEVLVWISVEQAALICRDLGLKDDALTGANQDGSCAGLIAQQLVPAHALDEVASPAGQTAHLLRVPVEVQALTSAQADQHMGACSGKTWRRTWLLFLISHNHDNARVMLKIMQ